MTQKHSPEPWCTDQMSHDDPLMDITIIAANDDRVGKIWIDDAPVEDFNATQRLNARRIVACVNACINIPTEWLEASVSFGGQTGEMMTLEAARSNARAWQSDLIKTKSQLDQTQTDADTWESRATKEVSRAADLQAQIDELLAVVELAQVALFHCSEGGELQRKAHEVAIKVINKITGEPK